ncbi:hypothetical protein GURASL_07930 [Geotalea uraniireducens]|uniref:GAF domain-containing protein n=1 Tax=Geotalea uraniireducens TaxID=351604 RepID=A0ABM8EHG2_9BACT|nr:GAF domain-containing protein [Geotalea uraniireducens]BDV41870.1 hypothetical protein GURASL_07930 [Geotalea uraniireducens]
MNNSDSFDKLAEIAMLLEQHANPEDNLDAFVRMTAEFFKVTDCSVMLFSPETAEDGPSLRQFARSGDRPSPDRISRTIAGQVAAARHPVMVDDITRSPYHPLARHPDSPSRCFISVPIPIGSRVAGVLNLSTPRDGRPLTAGDLALAGAVAILAGKSIQLAELRGRFDSRLVQATVSRETWKMVAGKPPGLAPDLARLAKIAGRTFYREMNRAGLGAEHILKAATEIVTLLGDNLRRHQQRFQTHPDAKPSTNRAEDS